MRTLILLALLAIPAFAQIGGGGGNGGSKGGLTTGTALPATCTVGQTYSLTSGSIGIYQCTATNTWTKQLAPDSSGNVFAGGVSLGSQNSLGADILNGGGNFAVNGLTGWTAALGSLSDWSIVGGNLHHDPASLQEDILQVLAPITQNGIYLGVVTVVSQSAGAVKWNLGDECNSTCSDSLNVGANQFFALACCDTGSTPIQIDVSQDSDVTISIFTVQASLPTFLNTFSGTSNIGVGVNIFSQGLSGYDNVAIGRSDLNSITTGTNNIALGPNALIKTTTGGSNISIGYNNLNNLSTGNENVAIGRVSCLDIVAGSNNVCIGSFAGFTGGGDASNKLFVEETFANRATPLIGGDFTARTVSLNGTQIFDTDHLVLPGTSSAGHAMCWKTATTLGYCSTAPDSGGACTCN